MDRVRPLTSSNAKVLTLTMWDVSVARVFEANRLGLIAVAARVCGQDQAADVAQDAYIQVWANPDAFDETKVSLTRYLYLTTCDVSIDRAAASQCARPPKDHPRTGIATDDPDR